MNYYSKHWQSWFSKETSYLMSCAKECSRNAHGTVLDTKIRYIIQNFLRYKTNWKIFWNFEENTGNNSSRGQPFRLTLLLQVKCVLQLFPRQVKSIFYAFQPSGCFQSSFFFRPLYELNVFTEHPRLSSYSTKLSTTLHFKLSLFSTLCFSKVLWTCTSDNRFYQASVFSFSWLFSKLIDAILRHYVLSWKEICLLLLHM